MSTYLAKARRTGIRWRVVNAEGQVLGRLAARTARVLAGKDSADWTPSSDHRDGVIVVNAEKVRLTGRKLEQKFYRHYTGFPGGLREVRARDMMEKRPERVIREAILGMLPKTRMGDRLGVRLKIYKGPNHPHQGQNPEPLNLTR